jgi:HlyD family secretion protein
MPLRLPRARWLWPAVAAGVALAGLLAWFALRGAPSEAVAARYAPLVRTLQFSARVATLSRVDVGSTVTGRVEAVLVREGDQVRQDQPLLRLESEELQAALAQAAATEQQAGATLVNAQAELKRTEALVAQGFVTASRADDARRAVDVALAQRQAARAAIAAAKARLTQAVITAPAAARVLSRQVEPGQIVQPGKALLGLALAGPTQIVAQVDERFLEQLRVGQKAVVVADAFAGQRLAATILSIAPEVDAQRGAVEVKFSLDQPPPAFLREDMTLSAEVETARRDRALVLPSRALRTGPAGETMLVVEGHRAVERPVRTDLRTLDAVELLSGVKEGELVLLAPTLKPGARVRAQRIEWEPSRSPQVRGGGGSGDPLSGISQTMGR